MTATRKKNMATTYNASLMYRCACGQLPSEGNFPKKNNDRVASTPMYCVTIRLGLIQFKQSTKLPYVGNATADASVVTVLIIEKAVEYDFLSGVICSNILGYRAAKTIVLSTLNTTLNDNHPTPSRIILNLDGGLGSFKSTETGDSGDVGDVSWSSCCISVNGKLRNYKTVRLFSKHKQKTR
jgi:hypothetical protein